MCDSDKYFWRQILVLFTDCLHAISVGFILSFPSALNPAILSPNTTDIKATTDQASWIASIYGFAGIIGYCIVPFFMQSYGRKIVQYILNTVVLIGFIMLAFAENVATLYAARTIQGVSICGVHLTNIILAEYADPKRRGYFITLQKGICALGSLMCHTLVLACTWRQIAAIALIPNVMALFLSFFWSESPAYFAMKGNYEECKTVHIYLNGDTLQSRKDLEDLISAQIERREKKEKEAKKANKLIAFFKKFIRKDFLKPLFIATLLTIIIDSCGRYYNLVYIVQIVKIITGNQSVAIYCSIGVDILTVISCCTSSYVITKFARRTMLFIFGYFSVGLMFLITIIVYLKSMNIASDIVWITPGIILLNSFIINLGIIPVCFTVSGEVFPLEHRGSGSTISGIIFTLLYAVTMKCTPIMMEKTGIEGTYGIYGLCFVTCLIILHFILPETKDKTLQEIEDEIKGIKRCSPKPQEREFLSIS